MRNLLFKMRYKGTGYHGFQFQKNALTIEEVLKKAIKSILLTGVNITGCSRTDTGVHANEYYFNMITDTKIPEESLIRALNTKIPDDMVILECSEVSLDFHARYHAKSKEYVYKILNSKFKDPFLQDLALRYTYSMDMGLIEKVAEKFVGQHDFAAFCSSGSQSVNTVRTIYDFDVTKNGDIVELTIKGNGFLYNMVRIIVGTILFVNEGKIAVEEIDDIIKNKDRRKAGRTAKACGLYLNKVEY